jgi:DNA-binding NtrC family response regulator
VASLEELVKTKDLQRSQLSPQDAQGSPGLVVVYSPDAARVQEFYPLAQPLTVGRKEGETDGAGLAISDPGISREHASLHWRSDGKGCEVRDLGSRNGTFLQGRRITSELAPLGSVLRVGDTFLEVAVKAEEAPPHPTLRGQSAALRRLVHDIHRVAHSDVSILIEGETGTGKELVAEAIHVLSGRPGRLVAINCASIPPEIAESYLFGHRKGTFTGASQDSDGIFEQAQEGTLFLDEIGQLRLDLQAKLLRVLETRQFLPLGAVATRLTSARFVSATNAKLRVQVGSGTFRSDLFARLAGVEISVPALRQRRSDIPLLISHFLSLAAPEARFVFTPNALELLLLHDWPMNIRELRAICGRLALAHPAGGLLRTAEVAGVLQSEPQDEDRVPTAEGVLASAPSRAELCDLLRSHRGNVVKLAAHYGKDRRQIYRWLELHGLDPRDFR